jgi:glycosyltransferase involved in cell wall biosynthesis
MAGHQLPAKHMHPTLSPAGHAPAEKENVAPLKGRDIVIVGLQPWYFATGCNAKNIAWELAAHNRVLYVNFPIKRNAYFAKDPDPKIQQHVDILREKSEKIKPIGPNLWEFYPGSLIESVNGLPITTLVRSVVRFNNRRFAKDIREAIAALGFKDIILLNDNDVYNGFYLKEFLSPSLYIYYFRDFLQGYDYWKKHISVLEPQLLRKADLVVANSLYYAQYSTEFNPHSWYIGQGCDLSFFDHTRSFPVQEDITPLTGPIIGYVGALDSARLDLDIIATIAKHNPAWNVVLVGPEDDTFRQSHLHQLPNIHFLGGKPFPLLAAYVQSFTVCINPQLKNQITKGNYPLKIDEYLAMGKPVVATNTQAMQIFNEHTSLANSPAEYPALIETAIAGDSPEKQRERIRFAHTHTWENCMLELYKAINHINPTHQ